MELIFFCDDGGKTKQKTVDVEDALKEFQHAFRLCCPDILYSTNPINFGGTFFNTPYYSVIRHKIFTCSNDAGDKAQACCSIDKTECYRTKRSESKK